MVNSLILKVTNDKYEFIVDIYDTTKDMAIKLNISTSKARSLLSYKPKKKKFKYVRVWFKKEKQNEQN